MKHGDTSLGNSDINPRIYIHIRIHSPLAKAIAMTMGFTIFVSCVGFVVGTMPRFECVFVFDATVKRDDVVTHA